MKKTNVIITYIVFIFVLVLMLMFPISYIDTLNIYKKEENKIINVCTSIKLKQDALGKNLEDIKNNNVCKTKIDVCKSIWDDTGENIKNINSLLDDCTSLNYCPGKEIKKNSSIIGTVTFIFSFFILFLAIYVYQKNAGYVKKATYIYTFLLFAIYLTYFIIAIMITSASSGIKC